MLVVSVLTQNLRESETSRSCMVLGFIENSSKAKLSRASGVKERCATGTYCMGLRMLNGQKESALTSMSHPSTHIH